MIVVDASVFNKLFLDEPDRPQAQALFRHAIEQDIPLLAPQLLLYEVLSTALHYLVPFAEVHDLLALQRAAGMRLVEPSLAVIKRAHGIATSGNAKAGHPALEDSLFHALALELGGIFVTADKKHVSKTKSFGGVQLLADWKT
jgi:predicted nucleic acid-binding protein